MAGSKSSRLRLSDVRASYRLVCECRDLGDDPMLWRQRLFTALKSMFGADIIVRVEISHGRTMRLIQIGGLDWGWEARIDRTGCDRDIVDFHAKSRPHPLVREVLAWLTAWDAEMLWLPKRLDRPWDDSLERERVRTSAGADRMLHSFCRMANREALSGLFLNRRIEEHHFTGREWRLVHLIHEEIAPLVGGPLTSFEEPSPSTLAPRVRQVLSCLLEGDANKQISLRLNLRPHTVNQYVKQIFRHFQVNSRSELLARWVRRGWSAKRVWTE